jgi:predicted ATPase
LTSFIGRTQEIAEVKRLLGAARLVTLTGSGGAGKTRLALQVAAEMVDGYPDGVWLAEFAPIADPTLVPKTVASALNVSEQPGRDITATLVDALRPKTLLLVLDNCEHILAACADLAAALLSACPQSLVTASWRPGQVFGAASGFCSTRRSSSLDASRGGHPRICSPGPKPMR